MPDLELARTVLRQGEVRLQEQRALAVAMDQRAAALAGIFATGAAAGFGFAVQAGMDPAARIGIGMAALGLTVAALCTVRAEWPGTLWLAGADPANWWSDGVEGRALYDCLKRESWNYAARIKKNAALVEGAARWFRWGCWIGVTSPALGAVLAVVAWAWN